MDNFKLQFNLGLLLYFPTLFIINVCRQVYYKMQLRRLNIFQLFITFISLIVTLFLTSLINQFSSAVDDTFTIYPPLTNSQIDPNTNFLQPWTYIGIAFIVLQLTVFLLTVIKTFRRTEKH
jgi:uncharacterized BrkB/YihY/UPF0761 family membrane protein